MAERGRHCGFRFGTEAGDKPFGPAQSQQAQGCTLFRRRCRRANANGRWVGVLVDGGTRGRHIVLVTGEVTIAGRGLMAAARWGKVITPGCFGDRLLAVLGATKLRSGLRSGDFTESLRAGPRVRGCRGVLGELHNVLDPSGLEQLDGIAWKGAHRFF